jgi:hypothetical protein
MKLWIALTLSRMALSHLGRCNILGAVTYCHCFILGEGVGVGELVGVKHEHLLMVDHASVIMEDCCTSLATCQIKCVLAFS